MSGPKAFGDFVSLIALGDMSWCKSILACVSQSAFLGGVCLFGINLFLQRLLLHFTAPRMEYDVSMVLTGLFGR